MERRFDRIRFHTVRRNRALTLEDIAQRTGLSLGGLKKISRGAREPGLHTYGLLISCLDLDDGDLWIDSEAAQTTSPATSAEVA
ncbi:helix-turn-helix transcriptional regulator [Nocardiopsis sp. NPDC049922]|uniref:helix-turn-helix domain-containing protein n=1 Tax=Nocardiopsis sp. NPDC049922 TaxID=3155157 RepID=UPI0033CC6FD0